MRTVVFHCQFTRTFALLPHLYKKVYQRKIKSQTQFISHLRSGRLLASYVKKLKIEYADFMIRLEQAVKNGKIFTHDRRTILEMSKKVLENIAAKYNNIQKEVKEIMGGRVLDYEGRNIFYEGIERGKREANFETARRLRDAGMSDIQIHQFTNLSLDDLKIL